MQIAAIEIAKELITYSIEILKINYSTAPNTNIKYNKLLKSIKDNEILQIVIYIILYIDDSSFPFNNRDYMILGTKIYINIIVKFELTMHTGKNNKAFKTEVIFIPSTIILYQWRNSKSIIYNDQNTTNTISKIIKRKKLLT